MSHALSKKMSASHIISREAFMIFYAFYWHRSYMPFPPFSLIFWWSTSTQKVWNNYFRQRLRPVTTSSHWWQAGVVFGLRHVVLQI